MHEILHAKQIITHHKVGTYKETRCLPIVVIVFHETFEVVISVCKVNVSNISSNLVFLESGSHILVLL